jgi:hypothetical protein
MSGGFKSAYGASKGSSKEPQRSTINLPRIKGTYYEATVPDTLDLADKAELALNGLLGTLDPGLGYENYFNAWLDVHPAYQTHEHPGGLATINCKYAEAIPQMLVMCGSKKFLEPENDPGDGGPH